YKTKLTTELDDTNTGIPDEIGLKASMLDPQVLKLLLFITKDKCKNTETQLYAELEALEA
ncbi:24802_t:CDS:2, partial [Cetraspora pellucida]